MPVGDFAELIGDQLGEKHGKKVIAREDFRIDGKGCEFVDNLDVTELNREDLCSVVFP